MPELGSMENQIFLIQRKGDVEFIKDFELIMIILRLLHLS